MAKDEGVEYMGHDVEALIYCNCHIYTIHAFGKVKANERYNVIGFSKVSVESSRTCGRAASQLNEQNIKMEK